MAEFNLKQTPMFSHIFDIYHSGKFRFSDNMKNRGIFEFEKFLLVKVGLFPSKNAAVGKLYFLLFLTIMIFILMVLYTNMDKRSLLLFNFKMTCHDVSLKKPYTNFLRHFAIRGQFIILWIFTTPQIFSAKVLSVKEQIIFQTNFARLHGSLDEIAILLPEFIILFATIFKLMMFTYNRKKLQKFYEALIFEWNECN